MVEPTTKIQDRSKEFLRKLEPAARKAFNRVGTRAVRDIKGHTPVGETGNLKRSIGKKVGPVKNKPDEIQLEVGARRGRSKNTRGWHAHFVEKGTGERTRKKSGGGTGEMPANPFIEKGTRNLAKDFQREFAIEAKKIRV